jgi:tripeptidyl-peptidase-1
VKEANDLLLANFEIYIHPASNATSIRTLSYSVPANLAGSISLIIPTTT